MPQSAIEYRIKLRGIIYIKKMLNKRYNFNFSFLYHAITKDAKNTWNSTNLSVKKTNCLHRN